MDHRRHRVKWGVNGTRSVTSDDYWRHPLKWDRDAAKAGERRRVFCASLADVFEDRPELVEPRGRLLELIQHTPHLDWLLLTKRPENIIELWDRAAPSGMVYPMPNVWLGASVEDQARKGRIDELRAIPAAVRFLSLEPLLEGLGELDLAGIDWVIIGGESGHGARPCNVFWIRSIIRQCKEAGVKVFCKQLGSRPLYHHVAIRDKKGGEPSEWPDDIRVREFPQIGVAP